MIFSTVYGRGIGDIGLHGFAFAAGGLHRCHHLLCGSGIAAIEEEHVHAVAREKLHHRAADAAAAAGDQRHLAGQA
jgi:hypothetical protein